MEQIKIGEFLNSSKLENFSKEELIQRYQIIADELTRAAQEIYRLKNQTLTDAQLKLVLEEQLSELQGDLYGASSERYKKPEKEKNPNPGPAKPRVKKPSERYPNVPVKEVVISQSPLPNCTACGEIMSDSGMSEDSEQLTVIPKKFEITLQKRTKYRCSCQACVLTAPAPPRIIPGSTYSDEMIMDVVLSKYCDLIPIERYAAMAARSGLINLPPHSLIELTHAFADFISVVYKLIEHGIKKSRVLHADETPHKMVEGSDIKKWYLWGFSTPSLCFLECRNTRSGDIASNILVNSNCEVLVSDVFSGYARAIRLSNEQRVLTGKKNIQNGNCNAHARRCFYKPRVHYKECEFYLEQYHQIYKLNTKAKGKSPKEVLEIRSEMRPHFEAMKKQALAELLKYPAKNKYNKALTYFLENYTGLTLFLEHADVAIDNNLQERLLRNHVIGRKTWYGTHSERGSITAAILFSVIETCKLNHVNPREYFPRLIQDLLDDKAPYTPADFKLMSSASASEPSTSD